MPLRLGDLAPDFTCDSTQGRLTFSQWHKLSLTWTLFFSHPADFTPVCTTELAALAHAQPAFDALNVKLLGLSIDPVAMHQAWSRDICHLLPTEDSLTTLPFPLLADEDGSVAQLYDMLDNSQHDPTNTTLRQGKAMPLTVRSVFLIDTHQRIRCIWTYPAAVGRNVNELLRVCEAMQRSDAHPIALPVNWRSGEEVLIRVDLSDEEARRRFPSYRTVLPYLRYTQDPAR